MASIEVDAFPNPHDAGGIDLDQAATARNLQAPGLGDTLNFTKSVAG